jgi:RNA polymerase sigma-70 factor (ECF subfamily)
VTGDSCERPEQQPRPGDGSPEHSPSPAAADEDLIGAFQGGDGSAFDLLAAKYSAKGLRLARSYLGGDEEAEDVVQEALVASWRVLRDWRPEAQFGTWFYRTVVNLSLSALRDRRRRRAEPLANGLQAAAAESDAAEDAPAALAKALESLTERERAVLSLKFDSGLSSEEIGRVLGISPSTVRVHVSKALHTLRSRLRKG